MTTVEALKALYVALGGNAADFSNITLIPDAISKIASIVTAIPSVETAANGSVLVVSAGKPAWIVPTSVEGLPNYDAASNGDVLMIVDNEPAWQAPASSTAQE